MLRVLGPFCLFALAACDVSGVSAASVDPGVRLLCGTWTSEAGSRERWELDGDNLVGQGRHGDEIEQLALLVGPQGHTYVAQPSRAAVTEFMPIDPNAARFSIQAPPGAQVWVWANYAHDFPQEIHYALLTNEGRLVATVVGPGDDGQPRTVAWTFARTASCVVIS